jgi:DNA polymerase III sliding clamp (beta) subunit (PCNA family)
MNRMTLLKILEKVKPGLSQNEIIEQSTSFAFMGDRVVTYNDEISISHPVNELNITGAVKAEELYQLLGKLKKDEVVIEASENELILTCGKTRAGLAFQEEISLPLEEVGEIGDWKSLPEGFCEAVAFVIPSASRNMVVPAFTAVHVRKNGIIEASDGYRVTQKKLTEIGLENCLIPAHVAKELIKYPITHQASGEGWRHFKTEDGTIFSCRILEEKYPDIEAMGIMNVEGRFLNGRKSWERLLTEPKSSGMKRSV